MENFVLNEDAEDGGDEQDNQTDEKHTPARSKVIFALFIEKSGTKHKMLVLGNKMFQKILQ